MYDRPQKQASEKADQSTFSSGVMVMSYQLVMKTFFAIVCIFGRFGKAGHICPSYLLIMPAEDNI